MKEKYPWKQGISFLEKNLGSIFNIKEINKLDEETYNN